MVNEDARCFVALVLEKGLTGVGQEAVNADEVLRCIEVLLVLGPLSRNDGEQRFLIVGCLGVDHLENGQKDAEEGLIETVFAGFGDQILANLEFFMVPVLSDVLQ